MKKFVHQVMELAYVRDRIDRGFGDERVFALQQEEVDGVVAARAAAGPALHWLNGYRLPRASVPEPRSCALGRVSGKLAPMRSQRPATSAPPCPSCGP